MKGDKKAQLKMSFGMIFSIILIILFIALAFFGIKKFLSLQDYTQSEKLKNDLQEDINNMWKSSQGAQELEYSVPRKIEGVCFNESELENFYFLPKGKYSGALLENLDLSSLKEGKPLCIENIGGKITLTLEKEFGENSVIVKK